MTLSYRCPHTPGPEGKRSPALFSPFRLTGTAGGPAQRGSTAAAAAIGPGRLPSPRGWLGRRDHGGGAEQDGDPDPLQAASGSAGQQGSGERLGSAGPSVPGCCPAVAACAPTGPRWAPSGAAAAVGAAEQGPWGAPGQSGRGRRAVAGGWRSGRAVAKTCLSLCLRFSRASTAAPRTRAGPVSPTGSSCASTAPASTGPWACTSASSGACGAPAAWSGHPPWAASTGIGRETLSRSDHLGVCVACSLQVLGHSALPVPKWSF